MMGSVADYTAAYRSAPGPREELQDLPFLFRLAWTPAGYVPYEGRPADHRGHPLDLTVAGILDGLGGQALPIDTLRLPEALSWGLEPRHLTRGYRKQPGDHLTGRGAAAFLLAALKRHATRLDPELRPSRPGIADLLAAANRDLYRLSARLIRTGIGGQDAACIVGAAVTLCVLNGAGAMQYANAGDCRGALTGSRPGATRELSRKQTVARLDRDSEGTTTGQFDDHKVLSALGLQRDIEPHVLTGLWLPGEQVLVQLSDGAKEALMLSPELASIPWEQRTLALVLERLVAGRSSGETRMFPLVAQVFQEHVLPHVADPRSSRAAGLVFDNVTLLMLRHADKLSVALDHLYQGIASGSVALLGRSPFEIDARELHVQAWAAGLGRPEELRALAALVEAKGLRVRRASSGPPRVAHTLADTAAQALPS